MKQKLEIYRNNKSQSQRRNKVYSTIPENSRFKDEEYKKKILYLEKENEQFRKKLESVMNQRENFDKFM